MISDKFFQGVDGLADDLSHLALEQRSRSVPALKSCDFSINSTGSFSNLPSYKPQLQGLYDQGLKVRRNGITDENYMFVF